MFTKLEKVFHYGSIRRVEYSYFLRGNKRITEKIIIHFRYGSPFEYTPPITLPPEPVFDTEKVFVEISKLESPSDVYDYWYKNISRWQNKKLKLMKKSI